MRGGKEYARRCTSLPRRRSRSRKSRKALQQHKVLQAKGVAVSFDPPVREVEGLPMKLTHAYPPVKAYMKREIGRMIDPTITLAPQRRLAEGLRGTQRKVLLTRVQSCFRESPIGCCLAIHRLLIWHAEHGEQKTYHDGNEHCSGDASRKSTDVRLAEALSAVGT